MSRYALDEIDGRDWTSGEGDAADAEQTARVRIKIGHMTGIRGYRVLVDERHVSSVLIDAQSGRVQTVKVAT